MKNDKDLPAKSYGLLKKLKRIADQKKGTMLQFWAKQATALPTKTVDPPQLPIQFLPNSSQFHEIDSDCATVADAEPEKSKKPAKAGVSQTEAQNETKKESDAINSDLTWLYNRKSTGILTEKQEIE